MTVGMDQGEVDDRPVNEWPSADEMWDECTSNRAGIHSMLSFYADAYSAAVAAIERDDRDGFAVAWSRLVAGPFDHSNSASIGGTRDGVRPPP
jgi:hypothetical protein